MAAPTGIRRVWMAVVLGSLTALAPLSMDMYLPALPALVGDLRTQPSLVQLTLTACLLGMALGQLTGGPLSDARGRRMPLLVGLGVYVLASALCVAAPSIWALLLLRFVQGFAGATGIVIARAIARDHYTGHALTQFFALLMLVNGAAPVLAPIVGGQLLRVTSWRGVFVVLAGLGLLMWLAVAAGLPESLPRDRRLTGGLGKTVRVFGQLATDRLFMGYVLAQSLVYAGMFAYIGGSPFVLQRLFGVSPQGFSLIFAINSIGIITATQAAARQAYRFGERRVLLTGLSIASAGGTLLLLAVLAGATGAASAATSGAAAGVGAAGAAAGLSSAAQSVPLWTVLVPLFLSVASVGAVGTTSTSLALQTKGESAGSASAMIGTCQMILGSLAAPLTGLGGSMSALPMGLVIAVCDVGALAVFLVLTRRWAAARK
ncbi:multidrug effflux MFS transporter [Alicyclobacillus sp.]|uniref:multidrug effflux MFS transporter n=1 Tax=Alicyclobacillus sp. TaxID=61169 RepID=UPI0025BE1C11|nr:multidrug effflux MFS transporter [Alicyclobacillus sp.]MCL6516806.1 multidrug effflux MFS transporter [Alicyclobacillus sp.]